MKLAALANLGSKRIRSLRARVVATALIAVGAAAALVVGAIALFIGPVVQKAQIHQMQDILQTAFTMDGLVPPDRMIEQLTRPGVSVAVSIDDNRGEFGEPLGGSARLFQTRDSLIVRGHLPISGYEITITTANSAALDIFGLTMAIGVPAMLIIMAILAFALWRGMGRALKPLDEMTALANQIASGERGGRLNVSLESADTELGRTAVAFDGMLDNLETSLNRAQQAETGLRQLTADVAHELRSPLASIVATADNLIRSGAGGKRAAVEQAAISVVREGQRAARIVGDLTQLSQLDVSELADAQVNRREADIVPLIESVVREAGKHIEYPIELQADPKLKTAVLSIDPERISQILNNLLQNAGRWAEKHIQVRSGSDGQVFWIQVLDDGPGVPVEERERIFDRFVRLQPDRDRQTGGSGLGLAISRSLAEAHGGSLRCIDHSGAGALFELRLPMLDSPQPALKKAGFTPR